MMKTYSHVHLADRSLLDTLNRVAAQGRTTTADLLDALLAKLEKQKFAKTDHHRPNNLDSNPGFASRPASLLTNSVNGSANSFALPPPFST